MSESDSRMSVWGFVKGFGKLMIGFLLLIQGLIGLFVMLLFVGILVGISNGVGGNNDKIQVTIPDGAALVLNPNGVLVEQSEEEDPFQILIEEAYGRNEPQQIEVHDVVQVIREAKSDDRIKGLVLDLGRMQVPASSASKLHYIVDELRDFKESGKPVTAIGDYYSQDQYLLAANADQIYMNDYGNVVLYGYGRYSTFVKSLLEKLKVTSHVFRVGTFKSAVEPFLRDDMSPEAKEANAAYLNVLWDTYAASVAEARDMQPDEVKNFADNLGAIMSTTNGDFAKAALNSGLIDELKSRAEQNDYLIGIYGDDDNGKSYKKVGFRRYLAAVDGDKDGSDPNIAVITAAGTIIDGEAPAGQAAGGDTIAGYLKKAREDDDVKAVVLRIDSPGGSAFASDIMRDEILALKAAGKPIVASMGSLAASGGYWIAAPADEIWASPTTITGSIGIFGYFNTFENTAAEIGLYVDGVGTSSLSPLLATGIGPLPDAASDIIQQSIENGYDRFLKVVGEGRGLEPSYVDSVGQGRVWIGGRAQELQLVDKLGDIDDAIAAAAALAELEDYDVVDMTEKRTPFEVFFGTAAAKALAATGLDKTIRSQSQSPAGKLVKQAEEQFEFFSEFNDPNAAYARCLACE